MSRFELYIMVGSCPIDKRVVGAKCALLRSKGMPSGGSFSGHVVRKSLDQPFVGKGLARRSNVYCKGHQLMRRLSEPYVIATIALLRELSGGSDSLYIANREERRPALGMRDAVPPHCLGFLGDHPGAAV